MSTTNHTAEPWTHTKLCDGPKSKGPEACIGIMGAGLSVAWINLNPTKGDKIEDGMADAARIVACVNAMAGIKDPSVTISDLRAITAIEPDFDGEEDDDSAKVLELTACLRAAKRLARRALGGTP